MNAGELINLLSKVDAATPVKVAVMTNVPMWGTLSDDQITEAPEKPMLKVAHQNKFDVEGVQIGRDMPDGVYTIVICYDPQLPHELGEV